MDAEIIYTVCIEDMQFWRYELDDDQYFGYTWCNKEKEWQDGGIQFHSVELKEVLGNWKETIITETELKIWMIQ
jgi:hypothetical protein